MKNIVIIGAGYAGVLTAKKLAKKFKKRPGEVRITVIDKNSFHTMLTELHEVAACRVGEESVRIGYHKIFAGRRIDFVQDYVEKVDFEKKTVLGKKGVYPYDYIVVSAGSKPTYFGVPGAMENTFPLWSFEDAVRLKDRIHECFRQASAALGEDEKRKLLSFYVVGAGFTGVEMIGELAEYVPVLCSRYEIDPELVSLNNVDVLPRVVPTLPEKLSAKIQRRLEKMGVKVLLGANVVEIGADYIDYDRGGERTRSIAGTVIWVAGIESTDITRQIGCTLPNQRRCRLEADAYLRSAKDESVYIAGDNLLFTAEGETAPVPQMVENCEQSAHTVAHNLYCAVTGEGEMEKYAPKFHGVMVCVGGRYGQARVGTQKHMLNLPSFLAMFVKHFINLAYFVQVLGWNKIASYLKHEFFTVRDRRSFVGGHFSNRTPSFLLVPLRIWLGAVWAFEGVMKIVEGWLKKPMLEGFFGGATAWFNSILGATGSAAADAVSSATGAAAANAVSSATGAAGGAAASTGTLLFNFNFLGLFKAIFVSGKTLAESSVADYAFKLDVPLMNWFVNDVLLPRQGLSLAMQIFIVFAEILIGLSMMGGLFTTLSGLVSLVLLFMFACTTGLYLSSFWMVFAGIAILFGGGKIFGLDYYVMPRLKKGWSRIGWVRRSYIYHD
ncbi:MAG: FAD-dependent oxidoreductase [Clostridiaceae bacterium]|nr:FAD-dependent oxidoreductase [Eubacteriales bacterium]